jgi:hypothetical protein
MNSFKLTYSDGSSQVSSFNGDIRDAKDYWLGRWFNVGDNDWGESDIMIQVVTVEQLLKKEVA